MAWPEEFAIVEIYIKEFEKLKDEQINRIAYRENLFYLTLAVIGGGATIAYTKQEIASTFLLLLPLAIFVAGISYIACDRRIMEIGLYIQRELAPRIAHQANMDLKDVFNWETYIRQDPTRRDIRKRLQFWASFLLYTGSAVGAILAYASRKNGLGHLSLADWQCMNWIESIFCIVDIGLVGLLIWQFLSYRPFLKGNHPSAQKSMGVEIMRVFMASVAAAIAGVIVLHFGALFIPDCGNTLFAAFGVTITRLGSIATLTAFGVWSIGLIIGIIVGRK
jgi:hypothetical protein